MIQIALWNTVALGFAVALVSGILGTGLAWITSRVRLPGGSRLANLFSLPYAVPPYLLGMAWVVLGNPQVGLLKAFLPSSGIYGFLGMVFVLSSVAFAFPYLQLRAGFKRLDPALEEAARISGATPVRILMYISLPLLWPAVLNGMALAFLFAISAFGVPAILGLPVRQFVLTTLIYSELKTGGMEGMTRGLLLCLLLLGLAALLALLSYGIRRRRNIAVSGAKASRLSQIELGRWTPIVTGLLMTLLGVLVVLPWMALGLSALAPVAGSYHPADWTLKNIRSVLNLADFQNAFTHSLVTSMLGAGTVTTLGFLMGFWEVRKKSKWVLRISRLTRIPFAVPGTAIALLLILGGTYFSRVTGLFLSPLLLMGLAYMIKYAAVATGSLAEAYRQIHPTLEESARICGAKTGKLLTQIWFPLLRSHLAAVFFLAFLPMFTELTMSMMLTGPGGETLGTVLFQLQEYADQPSAAALAWLLLTCALIISVFAGRKKNEPT